MANQLVILVDQDSNRWVVTLKRSELPFINWPFCTSLRLNNPWNDSVFLRRTLITQEWKTNAPLQKTHCWNQFLAFCNEAFGLWVVVLLCKLYYYHLMIFSNTSGSCRWGEHSLTSQTVSDQIKMNTFKHRCDSVILNVPALCTWWGAVQLFGIFRKWHIHLYFQTETL